MLEKIGKNFFWDASFVTSNGQSTFGYMKRSLSGTSVCARVVENPVYFHADFSSYTSNELMCAFPPLEKTFSALLSCGTIIPIGM